MGAVAWLAWGVAYYGGRDHVDRDDKRCFDPSVVESPDSVPPEQVIAIDPTDQKLTLPFEQGRGSRRDQVVIDTRGRVARELEVRTTALRSGEFLIDEDDLRVRALGSGHRVKVDVCLDARTLDRLHSGSYSGTVSITDSRVSGVDVPATLTVQARYLWLLAPLVLAMPGLALWLIWTSFAHGQKARYRRGAVTTFITAVGATAAVFGAQGVGNPSWGGITTAAALVASMYAAATAATATFGSTGTAQRDQEPT